MITAAASSLSLKSRCRPFDARSGDYVGGRQHPPWWARRSRPSDCDQGTRPSGHVNRHQLSSHRLPSEGRHRHPRPYAPSDPGLPAACELLRRWRAVRLHQQPHRLDLPLGQLGRLQGQVRAPGPRHRRGILHGMSTLTSVSRGQRRDATPRSARSPQNERTPRRQQRESASPLPATSASRLVAQRRKRPSRDRRCSGRTATTSMYQSPKTGLFPLPGSGL